MASTFPIARLYTEVVASAADLFESLSEDDWARPVPCTPEWTVRDLLSHTAGAADDITNGRIEGAASEAWTAAQVERYRDDDPAMLIARWREQAKPVGEMIEMVGEARPVFDTHSHEHDLRHAIGQPGNRETETIARAAKALSRSVAKDAPCTVRLTTGDEYGEGPAAVEALTPFEVFRSRLGRRTPEQLREWAWSGPEADIDASIGQWFAFGPNLAPIHE